MPRSPEQPPWVTEVADTARFIGIKECTLERDQAFLLI
jgi:hypothetical protein